MRARLTLRGAALCMPFLLPPAASLCHRRGRCGPRRRSWLRRTAGRRSKGGQKDRRTEGRERESGKGASKSTAVSVCDHGDRAE